jgi:hypothetical protein
VSNFISNELPDKKSLRYDFLFEEGLKYAQKFSGDVWTDYNYHDPGVTFLEYLCYALTDLGYRANFQISDLFLFGKDNFNSVDENLLFGPALAFTSSPVTTNDYRKLIIDQVKKVVNVWVNPVLNNKRGIKGLFQIFIECSEELSDFEIRFLRREVEAVFHANRLVGHDLESIHILKKVYLSLEGVVTIESDSLGELVIAKIYAAIDKYLNPQVAFHDPFKLWQELGYAPDEIFNGPLPKYGYVFDDDLKPKVEAIYLSRIKELILSVEGVKEIRDIRLFKNGLPVFDGFIHFEQGEYPSIKYLDEVTEMFESGLKIYKNNSEYQTDLMLTKQLVSAEILSGSHYYHKEISYNQQLTEGKFSYDELVKHFSIHNELPDLFGVGKNGLSKNASKEMKVSSIQVASYLYFFEQIMASYLAQLANLRVLFSVNNKQNTYFNQVPSDISNLDQFIFDQTQHFQKLEEFSQNHGNFFDRKNRLLDHLLARFGEKIDEVNLKKLSPNFGSYISDESQSMVLDTKSSYLKAVIDLGKNKAKAFNIKGLDTWNSENVSGLEKRIALSLNIKNWSRRFLSESFLEMANIEDASKTKTWSVDNLSTSVGLVEVWKLPSENYVENKAHFFGKGRKFINYIFEAIYHDKTIYKISSSDENSHYLLMKQRDADRPFVLYESRRPEDCIHAKIKLEQTIKDIDQKSEGFHLLEHILLRPLEPVAYLFSFLNERGEQYIDGIYAGELDEQKIQSEDLISLGLDEENYSIVEEENGIDLSVYLYNSKHEPVAKLKKVFSSKPGAKKAILGAQDFFKKILSKTIEIDTVLEINNVAGSGTGDYADFSFSEEISFILPKWPHRFQKADFKKYLKELIQENIMAHHAVNIYFLELDELVRFEEVYQQWISAKNEYNPELKKLDALSLQLIQLLKEFKPEQ